MSNLTTISSRIGNKSRDVSTPRALTIILAGRGKGWNDFDSILVGNGEMSGLSADERHSAMTLWAISCSPIYSGDDLTKLDALGIEILTNDEVLQVQQHGNVATLVNSADAPQEQVWMAKNSDGSTTVALFNLDDRENAECESVVERC